MKAKSPTRPIPRTDSNAYRLPSFHYLDLAVGYPSEGVSLVDEKIHSFAGLGKADGVRGAWRDIHKKAIHRGEYKIGLYDGFGTGRQSSMLYEDLLSFSEELDSPFLTFWASFPHEGLMSEEEFERRLWRELSHVSTCDTVFQTSPSAPPDDRDESKDDFCFSLGGKAFFVTGLHAQSPRKSHRFEYPSLVFNLYTRASGMQAVHTLQRAS